mmetsp:Transcript_29710/g.79812  ORF Transcript_29710/g.79812 Transcript_29710/m.79812 type:complete len:143 (-) Transcript_29710:362-790(-)
MAPVPSRVLYVAAGMVLHAFISTLLRHAGKDTVRPKAHFVLLVRLTFRNEEKLQDFLRIFRPMAATVKATEPETLSYEVSRNNKKPLELVINERYATVDAYLNVHKETKHFKEFRPKLQSMQDGHDVEVSGDAFEELGVGYM